ncbi:hypothetical protein [Halocynthiibacter styelae]|uniref:Uncharacterized protein n=1 Tax=Halocynthiibacter styelae TaxID=2761955 RepID=A0A8J7LPB9_9RHOB|nr:hypothetical protein [Paenihalocynthiibacter styelae]MBI1493346.1 hypothetical protein [Paenihalocynthiibacter styelae]
MKMVMRKVAMMAVLTLGVSGANASADPSVDGQRAFPPVRTDVHEDMPSAPLNVPGHSPRAQEIFDQLAAEEKGASPRPSLQGVVIFSSKPAVDYPEGR